MPACAEPPVSFHGPHDTPEYAALFGAFHIVSPQGSQVLLAGDKEGVYSGPGASFGGITFPQELVHDVKLRSLVDWLSQLEAERQQSVRRAALPRFGLRQTTTIQRLSLQRCKPLSVCAVGCRWARSPISSPGPAGA